MAGYMTKLQGHVYDGSHKAGEVLTNGLFVEVAADKSVKKVTGAKDTIMKVVEKTELWGEPAVRLCVASVGADEVFLCENEWDVNADGEYNTALYACKIGDFVKMHRLLEGEELIITVDSELLGTLEVEGKVQPTAAGTIAVVGG